MASALRWEEPRAGVWHGFSGRLQVARVVRFGVGRAVDRHVFKLDHAHRLTTTQGYGTAATVEAAQAGAEAAWAAWLEAAALAPAGAP